MRTVKTTERFNAKGKLIERIIETIDTQELSTQPWQYVPYQPPFMPSYTIPGVCEPSITWTTTPVTTC